MPVSGHFEKSTKESSHDEIFGHRGLSIIIQKI
jgi:hypothetical protein